MGGMGLRGGTGEMGLMGGTGEMGGTGFGVMPKKIKINMFKMLPATLPDCRQASFP